MHEYRRFVQQQLDAHGWAQAELVRRSGLRRQLIWKILRDERDHLGQMPDESTMQALADGFGIPVERVRTAAARSLRGYDDDGTPLGADLSEVSVDVLLTEIRRRLLEKESVGASTKRPAAAAAASPARPPRPGRRARGGDGQRIEDAGSEPDVDAVLSKDEP